MDLQLFLEELFVKILGYTKPASSTETKFNLTTEYKNVKDSKKADGAIIIDEKVKAVIELKGTNTTDLGKIETQAFGYKNNQPHFVYMIPIFAKGKLSFGFLSILKLQNFEIMAFL